MATLRDVVLGQLGSSEYLLKKMTADLSDAEYFLPPVTGGNHAAWIVGHIAVSEDSMAATASGGTKQFAKERELFRGGQPCEARADDDRSQRPRRSARPGRSPVWRPSSTTRRPFTATYGIPSGNRFGSS